MKSFFEEKAREQDAAKGGTEQKRREMAKLQEEKVMKDRVEREFFDTEENYFKSLDIVVEVCSPLPTVVDNLLILRAYRSM